MRPVESCRFVQKSSKLLGPIIVVGVIEPLSVVIPMASLNSVVPLVLVYTDSPAFSQAM